MGQCLIANTGFSEDLSSVPSTFVQSLPMVPISTISELHIVPRHSLVNWASSSESQKRDLSSSRAQALRHLF